MIVHVETLDTEESTVTQPQPTATRDTAVEKKVTSPRSTSTNSTEGTEQNFVPWIPIETWHSSFLGFHKFCHGPSYPESS